MNVQITKNTVTDIESQCIVVTIDQAGKLSAAAEALNQASSNFLADRYQQGDIKGKLAETLLLPAVQGIKAQRVLLVGRGDKALTLTSLHKILNAIAKATQHLGGHITLAISDLVAQDHTEADSARFAAQAFTTAAYQYNQTLTQNVEPRPQTAELIWHSSNDGVTASDLQRGIDIGTGINHARLLGDLPANVCTPLHLVAEAKRLADENEVISTDIIDQDALEAMGAGAFVSVAKGSNIPGQMIIMHYRGASSDHPVHMLVGKGITFDSGGISIKPGAKMDEMKYDMGGAASVFGTMTALAHIKPNMNVTALVAAAENMPAGHASKPGDVVTSLSGQTIEILNTDAEGRLVLCDTLTYGIQEFKPASVVDIATLTGACMAALGGVNSGLLTEDDSMANELIKASKRTGDKVWRLPLQEEYQELLHSNFADMGNIGGPLAGATTAACFLSRFTQGTPWAHLDIAGTAWVGGGKEKGSTGRPVALLVDYLLAKA